MAIEGDIQTLLSTLVSGRCYPMNAPDKVVCPYITYQVISNVPVVDLGGRNGLENRRVQVDVFDRSYGGVKTLELAVKSAMDTATFKNVPLLFSELYEQDTKIYRVTMDYSIWT